MSAIDAFKATWSKANGTFGVGAPIEGVQVDQSGQFRQLQGAVESAAPGATWTGSGSDTYVDANIKHARTFGDLADLDGRLGKEVDRAAAVVQAGRRDLDTVRQWVNDAAARVPNTPAGQQVMWQVVGKGSGDVADIIQRSHGDLSAIAERIRGLGGEYEQLGTPKEGTGDGPMNIVGDGDDKGKTPVTTLDLTDIKRYPPFDPKHPERYGPPYPAYEIGPGTFVPSHDRPGEVINPPKAPLDWKDIDYRGPGSKAPGPGLMELVPGSGAWVPDPSSPGYQPHTPEIPVDMNKAEIIEANGPMRSGMMELYPGSNVAIPDPDANGPR